MLPSPTTERRAQGEYFLDVPRIPWTRYWIPSDRPLHLEGEHEDRRLEPVSSEMAE
jgi:hypothetical protein